MLFCFYCSSFDGSLIELKHNLWESYFDQILGKKELS